MKNITSIVALLILYLSVNRSFCGETLSIIIENSHESKLYAVPSIINIKEKIRINPTNIDDEKNSNSISDDIETWVVDREKISERFRLVIANGHLGIKQDYVYYEDFNLSKSGEELKINLKPYKINMDILVDPTFLVPKKSNDSSIEVVIQLFKIDEAGEVAITTSAEKVSNSEYKKEIFVFQPGKYWVQVRYKGGKIKGDDNEFLGYPVWGKIINVRDDSTNLRIVGDKCE